MGNNNLNNNPLSVFVSCRYAQEDIEIVDHFVEIIKSHGFDLFIADWPEPRSVPQKVRSHIRNRDGLIAIMTKMPEYPTRTSDWIQNEVGMAFAFDKPILAFVEMGISIEGIIPLITNYVFFDRGNLVEASLDINKFLTALRNELVKRKERKEIEELEKMEITDIVKKIDTDITPLLQNIREFFEKKNIFLTRDEEYFYSLGTEIITKSKIVRFASKTPTVVLYSERLSPERAKYFQTLKTAVTTGSVKAKYLFSYNTTREVMSIDAMKNKSATIAALEDATLLTTSKNMDLRAVYSDDFISCIIGETDAVYLWKSPVTNKAIGVVHIKDEAQVIQFQNYFDDIFELAERIDTFKTKKWIQEISSFNKKRKF